MKDRLAFTRKEIFYYIALLLFFSTHLFNLTIVVKESNLGSAFKYIRLISYIIFAGIIIASEIKNKILSGIILVLGLAGIVAFKASDNSIIYIAVIFFAGWCSTSRRNLKAIAIIQAVTIMIGVITCLTGVVENQIFMDNMRRRYMLGFTWVTTLPILFLYMSFSYIMLRREKITFIEILCILGIHITLYIFTDTRMCFLIGVLSVFFTIINRYGKNNIDRINRKLRKITPAVPIILAVTSVLLAVLYSEGNRIWEIINKLLSNRLYYGQLGIHKYGITVFGQPIVWIGYSFEEMKGVYNYVDCSYIQILLSYGIVFLMFVLGIYTKILLFAKKNNDSWITMIVVLTLIFSITEPRLWNLTFNPLPFLLIDAVKDRNSFSTQEVVSNV